MLLFAKNLLIILPLLLANLIVDIDGVVDNAQNGHNADGSHGNVSSPVDVEHDHHGVGSEAHLDTYQMNNGPQKSPQLSPNNSQRGSPNGSKSAASPSKTAEFQQKFANLKHKAEAKVEKIEGQVKNKIENKVAKLAMPYMDAFPNPDDGMVPDLNLIAKNMQTGDDLWTTLNEMVDAKSSMWNSIQDRNPWNCKATKEPKNCEAWEKLWKELGQTLVEAWRKVKYWAEQDVKKSGASSNKKNIEDKEKDILKQLHLYHTNDSDCMHLHSASPAQACPKSRIAFNNPAAAAGAAYDLHFALRAVIAARHAAPHLVALPDNHPKRDFRPALVHVDESAFGALVKSAFGTLDKEECAAKEKSSKKEAVKKYAGKFGINLGGNSGDHHNGGPKIMHTI